MFKWVTTILSLLSRIHKLKKDVNKNTYTVSVNFPWKTAWMRVLNGHESTTVPILRYPQTWAGGGGGFCNKDLLRIVRVVAKMMPTFDVECESCIARLAGLVPGLTLHRALVLLTTHFFHHLRLTGNNKGKVNLNAAQCSIMQLGLRVSRPVLGSIWHHAHVHVLADFFQ